MMKFKLFLYKFLGIFIPYFKRKYRKLLIDIFLNNKIIINNKLKPIIMTINYYINNWSFLQQKTYTHSAVPTINEHVILYINGQNNTYLVTDVVYENNDIKILLQ